jgi:tetratricopeptide (TPR) repeat protein
VQKKIFASKFTFLITVFVLLLFSCSHIPAEADAIKQNEEGVEFMNAGKYDSALLSFRIAGKNQKLSQQTKGTIYRNLALTYNQLDNIDSSVHFSTLAAKCFTKNSYGYLINMADVDLLTGKTAAALSKLLKAANLNPGEMAVNNTLGLIYSGEYDDAFINLEKALVYNTRAFEIYGGRVTEEVLARNYYKMEDYKNAESHYGHLLENYPDMIEYSLYSGMIKYKLKKNNEADLLFEKVISMDSSYRYTIQEFREENY